MPNLAYQLIALDLDGTLLGPDGQIGEVHHQALRAVRSAGIEVTLVTARAWRSTAPFVAELGLTAPVICVTGAAVYEPSGRLLEAQTLAPESVQQLARHADAKGWTVRLYESDGTVIQSRPASEYSNKEGASFAPPSLCTPALTEVVGQGRPYLQAVVLGDRSVEGLYSIVAEFGHVALIPYERGTSHSRLHLMNPAVSKGAALAAYCANRGLPREGVIAMGDTAADASMVAWAGTGVAVGDAPDVLRAAADLVIPPGDPAPVARALTQLGLI